MHLKNGAKSGKAREKMASANINVLDPQGPNHRDLLPATKFAPLIYFFTVNVLPTYNYTKNNAFQDR
jgi:hypothetical protein